MKYIITVSSFLLYSAFFTAHGMEGEKNPSSCHPPRTLKQLDEGLSKITGKKDPLKTKEQEEPFGWVENPECKNFIDAVNDQFVDINNASSQILRENMGEFLQGNAKPLLKSLDALLGLVKETLDEPTKIKFTELYTTTGGGASLETAITSYLLTINLKEFSKNNTIKDVQALDTVLKEHFLRTYDPSK